MSLSDIFTPSVVISLAISVLLIGLLALYVSNKLSEQNHKLNSMFDLVSTLANEVNMVRSKSFHDTLPHSIGGGPLPQAAAPNTNHLVNMIDVSDNSVADDDDDSDGDDSDDDSDGDCDDDNESDADEDGGDEDDDEDDDKSGNSNDDDKDDEDDDDEDSEADLEDAIVIPETFDITEGHVELTELDEFTLEETTTPSKSEQHESSNVKNLNVVIDYKKASVNKLREIVEQKGLASDTSKLKKPDLLKLLEVY
jgi:hypothetical protein